MKKYRIKIRFTTPYMQHRMDDVQLEEWERNRGRIIERGDLDKTSLRANYHSYIDENGKFYMPAEHLRQGFINGGAMSKSKVGNARKNMKNIVAATFMVANDVEIPPFDSIDKRSAVNKNVKARIIVVRPKWNNLEVQFELRILNDSITVETIKEIISNTGQFVGIGSYRPEHNGLFGQFEIVEFDEIK